MLLSICIFCVILLIYMHVCYHLKISNELEIYQLDEDELDKNKLEETCNLRQPIIFENKNNKLSNIFSYKSILNEFSIFDVKIRKWEENNNECQHVPLKMSLVGKLFSKEKDNLFYSERNLEFLHETGLIKHLKENDEIYRPYLNLSSNYDILFGSENSFTPLKYNLYNRNYFYVCDGSIKIKLIPPVFTKHLNIESDYENFEFRSPINAWEVQSKYNDNYSKSKVMEVVLSKNNVIYVPSYWCYTIQFQKEAIVLNTSYSTLMSNLSIIPQQCLYFFQQQNIKRKVNKCISDIEIDNN